MLGGFFPETGSLSYLGPDTVAAFKLAVKDVNAAGGVLGKDVNTAIADSSDADHADQNTSGVQSLLAKKPGVIIGSPSSSVTKNIYKQASGSKVPVISVEATSPSLSGIDEYFFRTIAPDGVQGAVMSNVIEQDSVQNLAIGVQRRVRHWVAQGDCQQARRQQRQHRLWQDRDLRPDRDEFLVTGDHAESIPSRRNSGNRLRSDQSAGQGNDQPGHQYQQAVPD